MENGGLVVSVTTLNLLFVTLLYLPICLISYRWPYRRLSPAAKGLASAMLVAQVLVILLSLALETQSATDFETWLWDFHEEWNIPATLASVQLAMVGGVALLTSWHAKLRPAWQRPYAVAIGLVFLFLALDEFLALHEAVPHWEMRYIALGAVVVLATMVVALRSPRSSWLWHSCLLLGLGISVAGAILLNAFPAPCGSLGLLRFDGCLEFFFVEESFEFLGIWLVLVAMLGQFSDAAPMSLPRANRILYALPGLWILLLLVYSLFPRLEFRLVAQPASIQYESGVHLHGFRIDYGKEKSILQLYASSRQKDYMGLGYSIHLVDQVSGESVASRDEWADRQHGVWLLGPKYSPVFRQRMEVNIPAQAQANRALWVVLTLWRKEGGEFVRRKILASDQPLLDDAQVVLGEQVLPAEPAPAPSVPLATFDNGLFLEVVELPKRAQAGATLTIPVAWRTDQSHDEDYIQFLHFGHEESGEWWVYDQEPLGPRLPTRLWYDGLADGETWDVPLPADLAPGRYNVFTGLYRLRDRERVPVRDAGGVPWLDARVLLGYLILEN